jgi:hypothetical protein
LTELLADAGLLKGSADDRGELEAGLARLVEALLAEHAGRLR